MSSATVLRGLISTISSGGNKSETHEAAASSCADVADELLMLRIQSGDRQALGVLYDRYSALILSVGLRILRDTNEAQELVQDVFLYVFESNQQYDCSKGQLRSWLVQIGYSRAFNKRHGRRGAVFEARYRDWTIRDEEHLANTKRYIEWNPVKDGNLATVEDWPWTTGWDSPFRRALKLPKGV